MLTATLHSQYRRFGKTFLTILAPIIVVLLGTFFFCLYSHVPFSRLTRDVLAMVRLPVYFGLISNIGMILWSFSASICFFSFYFFKNKAADTASFFFIGGILTLFVLFDDFFLFHEEVFPNLLGIGEIYFFVAYAAISLFFLGYNFSTIITTNYLYLLLAYFFLSGSIFFDLIGEFTRIRIPEPHLFEDGFKFLGIVTWLIYFFNTANLKFGYAFKGLATDPSDTVKQDFFPQKLTFLRKIVR